MTRICEKFVEDLSSGSANLTSEMQSHLLTCPECQEAFTAVSQLKQLRKPVSGKEALAIAGILKAVSAEAAASSAAINTAPAKAAGGLFKFVIAAIIATSVFLALSSDQRIRQEIRQPMNIIAEPSSQLGSISINTASNTVRSPVAETSGVIDALPAITVASATQITASASQTVSGQETDTSVEAQTIMVSPDQEEVKPH